MDTSRRSAVLVYLVIDVSASMWQKEDGEPERPRPDEIGRNLENTPWGVANQELATLVAVLKRNPTVRHTGWLRIIEFGDEARDVLTLTQIGQIKNIPPLGLQLQTDYRAAFDFVATRLRLDIETLANHCQGYHEGTVMPGALLRPLIYFVTDGNAYCDNAVQAPSVWSPAVGRVHGTTTPPTTRREYEPGSQIDGHSPVVVALGLGTDVKRQALEAVADRPDNAHVVTDDSDTAQHLKDILNTIIHSIINSTTGTAGFEWRETRGWR